MTNISIIENFELDLNQIEKTAFESYLLGWLAGCVETKELRQACINALQYVRERKLELD